METSSFAAAPRETDTLIDALTSRGWCFRDPNEVKALIIIQLALLGDSFTVDSIESEVSNLDLRSIGGKSLPDPSFLRKSSTLLGPKVLQISSARDISRSTLSDSWGMQHNHRRVLRLKLTDGHSEITAIEYTHIPSIPENVVPGTKVRLQNEAVVRSGIICLDPQLLIVLGGVVHSLHEEWKINQKFSGYSRSSLRIAQEGAGGPPPFVKLQIGMHLNEVTCQGRLLEYFPSTSKSFGICHVDKSQYSDSRGKLRVDINDSKQDGVENNVKSASNTERIEEKPSNSEVRQKEVVDYVPVQNQAASQKLLQKMSRPNYSRGRKHKGKGRQEESAFLTLDEWERRKAGVNYEVKEDHLQISQDENLACRLQKQIDLEDNDVQKCSDITEAENIRTCMFNFERNNSRGRGQVEFRGRQKGRRRGRGRRH